MRKNIKYDSVIIGGGPIGMYAAYALSMTGLQTCIIDTELQLGGQCSKLYPDKYIFDIPALPKILARDLVYNLQRQIQKFDINTYLDTHIKDIYQNETGFCIVINHYILYAKTIVIAIGEGNFIFNKLNITNLSVLEKKGYLQYNLTNKEIFRNKRVAIAGGGDAAADWAISLYELASHITIFHRRQTMRCIDSSQLFLQKMIDSDKLELQLSSRIQSIHENISQISISFINQENDNLIANYDFCVTCYGLKANKTILQILNDNIQPSLNQIGEIIIDPHTCQTSISGIFAVGDCAGYTSHKRSKLISIGFGEASIAAHHIRKYIFSDRQYKFQHSTSLFS